MNFQFMSLTTMNCKQGSAADLIKLAMIRVHDAISTSARSNEQNVHQGSSSWHFQGSCRLLLQVSYHTHKLILNGSETQTHMDIWIQIVRMPSHDVAQGNKLAGVDYVNEIIARHGSQIGSI